MDEELRDTLSKSIRAKVQGELSKAVGVEQQLPEGTVTIVFTDVEGSTELVRDLGDAPAHQILRRHDEILRGVLKSHHGTEVEHPGDGFMFAFRTARAAVAFALDLQQDLTDEQDARPEAPNIRIGMDTGEVIAEESGHFGTTVFRAARIADLARGRQVLVSEVTKVLVEPAGFSLRDIGEHELKGLGGRCRLFEVIEGPKPLPSGSSGLRGKGGQSQEHPFQRQPRVEIGLVGEVCPGFLDGPEREPGFGAGPSAARVRQRARPVEVDQEFRQSSGSERY